MALSPKQFHMHLYHGTSASNVDRIKAGGLTGDPFLTHDPDLAEHYANHHDDPAIVQVRVNPRNLVVDWNSFDDPVHGYDDKGKGRNFDESQIRGGSGKDWKNSLKQTGTVQHVGDIPPENVLGVK